MDYSSLPPPLPRLIPADQILPIMKRIVGQYQTVRENIIESVDVQKANFDNLIQPLVDIDNETQGDIAIIAMLRYSPPDPASCQGSEEACSLVNEDQAAFNARPDFWPLLKAVKEACQEISLHFEARKYLDKLFLEFKQFGYGTLRPVQIHEYLERRNYIDGMRRKYNQRIRQDAGGLWFSLDELAGVKKHDLDRFVKDPEKHDRRFVRFSAADSLVVYRNASESATRKRIYVGNVNNLSQNAKLFEKIVVERDLNARLVGYESHAAYRQEKRLMKTPAQVESLLADLHDRLLARGQHDMNLLMDLKRKESRESAKITEYDVNAIFPWDYWYYAREASKGRFIGYLYMDLLSRDNKYKGNQNVNLQCELTRSELGHGIHDLLARTNYVAFHGHRSPPDFAEAFSVMLEKWCWMKPELKRLGLHYTSKDLHLKEKWLREHPGEDLPPERIPDDTIDRLIKGRQVTRSLWYLRQLVYAHFDMKVHHPRSHTELRNMDSTKIFNDFLEKLWLVRAPQPEDQGYPHADLGHLVSGYDAGYYSYLRRVDLNLTIKND
uniref:Peptidase M3A/M3B catalytic domain-containing protein n=1 Tax=Fusarium oxysporum (strain Fo5176) TaxID=660025 RepID=A0A0D2XXK1_FUSOF